MTDIVERLRAAYTDWNCSADGVPNKGEVALHAADEIERLRAAIREAIAAEREECAKVADRVADAPPEKYGELYAGIIVGAEVIAAAIRSRSKEGGEG